MSFYIEPYKYMIIMILIYNPLLVEKVTILVRYSSLMR